MHQLCNFALAYMQVTQKSLGAGRNAAIAVFLVALTIRLALAMPMVGHLDRFYVSPDSFEYDKIAQNIVQGDGYSESSSPPFIPDLRRTPVYPYFLAALYRVSGHKPALAIGVNAVLGALTSVLVFLLGRRIIDHNAGLLAGLIIATDPTSVAYNLMLLTEPLFTFLLVLSIGYVIFAHRTGSRTALIAGAVLCGWGILTRPIGLFLPLFIGPTLRLLGPRTASRVSTRTAIGYIVLALSLPMAWTIHNYVVAGVPQFTSIMAINAYYYRAVPLQKREVGATDQPTHHALASPEGMDGQRPPSARDLARMEGSFIATVIADPIGYSILHARGVVRMLGPDTDIIFQITQSATARERGASTKNEATRSATENQHPCARSLVVALSSAQLLVLYLLATFGLIAGLRRPEQRNATVVVVVCLAYFVLVSGPEAYPRFRVPLMPFVAILAALGVRSVESVLLGRSASSSIFVRPGGVGD